MIYVFSFLMINSLVWLVFYKKKENSFYSLLFKLLSSLIFLSAGLYYSLTSTSDSKYAIIIVLGLLFGLIGDVFLVYINNKKCFFYGILSFLIGHLLYIYAFITKTDFKIYDLFILIVLLIVAVIMFKLFDLKLGKFKIPVYTYTFIIALMQTKAISFTYNNYHISNIWPILLGSVIFLISDIILSYITFKKYSIILTSFNLLFYYFGQLLIAYSLFYF